MTYSEFMNAILEFTNNPEDNDKVKAFEDVKSNLIIKTYLPIKDKQRIIRLVLSGSVLMTEGDYVDFALSCEMCLTLYGLLSYTNVKYDGTIIEGTPEAYDLIWSSGIGEYIQSMCDFDFKKLRELTFKEMDFYNLNDLVSTLGDFDFANIDALTKQMKSLNDKIGDDEYRDMIHDLASIIGNNDPFVNGVREGIDSSILSGLNSAN